MTLSVEKSSKYIAYSALMCALLLFFFISTGCTVSVILANSNGSASDLVDSMPSNKADLEAEIPLAKI